METLALVLGMLVAVALASAVARFVPVLPLPLVQIGVGIVIGATSGNDFRLEPDLFFLLFLPPLLFLDGWRLPKDEMRTEVRTVLGLATALVMCTVLGVGFLVHWLIPSMPLAVSFALAAVLSPTDPVAVSAIASRVAVPRRMMRILEGEALLNDASGLVCLRFAVAAAMSGSFSPVQAVGTFAWVAIAGLAVGAAIVLLTLKAGDLLLARVGTDPGWQVLVSLLLPFASYLVAEHVGASGILAAVGAGVAMTFGGRLTGGGAAARVQSASVWDFAQLALNGTIFVLLGAQLPHVLRDGTRAARDVGGWSKLALAAAAILVALIALRFAWSWFAFRRERSRNGMPALGRGTLARLMSAFSLAGVKGAVTLAGILTLPVTLPGGAPFPARDIAIFLATVVIIASLLTASFALPPVLRGIALPASGSTVAEERRLRTALLDAAVAAIREAGASQAGAEPAYDEAARREAERLDRLRPAVPGSGGDEEDLRRIERELQLIGLQAARDEASRLVLSGKAGSTLVNRLVRELDLSELRLGA